LVYKLRKNEDVSPAVENFESGGDCYDRKVVVIDSSRHRGRRASGNLGGIEAASGLIIDRYLISTASER